jgi:hypothetical protein
MKWFKHDTDAKDDLRIKLVRKQFGLEGYGMYFALLEVIGKAIDKGNIYEWGYVDKLHTVETLAEEIGADIEKLREFLLFSNKIGLLKKQKGRLYCKGILKRLDEYAEKIAKEKGVSLSELNRDFVGTKTSIEKNRKEKIRIEQKRIEKTVSTEDGGVGKSPIRENLVREKLVTLGLKSKKT